MYFFHLLYLFFVYFSFRSTPTDNSLRSPITPGTAPIAESTALPLPSVSPDNSGTTTSLSNSSNDSYQRFDQSFNISAAADNIRPISYRRSITEE